MENAHLTLFICLITPLAMMLLVFRGRSRAVLSFLLTGIVMCLLAGEINGLLLNISGLDMHFMTVNVTPIVEEMLKALPIVFAAFLIKPDRQLLLECSFSVGIGFATLENICILFDSAGSLSVVFALIRGLGAGLMHGVCTLAAGYALTYVNTKRLLSHAGTFAALSAAVIYHSIYNILVQSDYSMLGILLPIATYIPMLSVIGKKLRKG